MYAGLWKRVPGNKLTKTLIVLVLVAGLLALLFEVVFPYVSGFFAEELV